MKKILLAIKTQKIDAKINYYLISRVHMRGDDESIRVASDLARRYRLRLESYAFIKLMFTLIGVGLAASGCFFWSIGTTIEIGRIGVVAICLLFILSLLFFCSAFLIAIFGRSVAFRSNLLSVRSMGIRIFPLK